MTTTDGKSETGREGERMAVEYLIKKGYSILEKNYRYRRSEIDIIAIKDDLLIFVEVKTKTSVSFGYPEESVNSRKIEKVLEGADQYIYETDWNYNIRFDIIAIDYLTRQITHFEDAFY